jgi:hypothetical protein
MTRSLRRELFPLAAIFALGVGLAAFAYRTGRLLTFDGYYYCELAKGFSQSWPDRFGNHWPFGYPLMGGLVARMGIPAYEALCLVSLVMFAALLTLAANILEKHPFRWAVLTALAATPILGVQLFGVLAELPFAAILLGLAASLAHWPRRTALWSAALCAVLSLGIRYAGVITLAILAGWLISQSKMLRSTRRLGEAIAAWVAASAAMSLLLVINVYKSHHASGADRGPMPGFSTFPRQCMDLGWSALSALVSGGLRDRIGVGTPVGKLIGGLVFFALGTLCLWAWVRPSSRYSRPLALTAFGYTIGMAGLRCIGNFDALYNARTFLPALFPLGLLFAERTMACRASVLVGCALLLASGLIASVRGISRQIGGDVHAAIAPLRLRLGPGDTVAINDDAFSLAAYIPQMTHRVWFEYWPDELADRFLVVAAQPRDRAGNNALLSPGWTNLCARLTASGHYKCLVQTSSVIVLEKSR